MSETAELERRAFKNLVQSMAQDAERRWAYEESHGKYERKHLLDLPHDPTTCPLCP